MKRILVILMMLFACVLNVHADDLRRFVPADSVAYFGWECGTSMGDVYTNSNAAKIAEKIGLEKQIDQVAELIGKIVAEENGNPQAAMQVNMVVGLIKSLSKTDVAIYVRGGLRMDIPIEVGLICKSETEKAQLLGSMQMFNMMSGGSDQGIVQIIDNDEIFGMIVGGQADAGLQDYGSHDAITNNDSFKKLIAAGQSKAMIVGMLDVQGLLALLGEQGVFEISQMQGGPDPIIILDELGILGIDSVGFRAGILGKDWEHVTAIFTEGERKGLLKNLETDPISDEDLAVVPMTATYMQVVKFDIAKLVEGIKQFAFKMEPEAESQFNQGIAMARAMTGVDVESDVIKQLGNTWAMYTDPGVGVPNILGICVTNKVKDGSKLAATIDKLVAFANQQITKNNDGPMQFTIRQIQEEGMTIHTLPVMILSPAIAVKNDCLIFALNPQAVMVAGDQISSDNGTIVDNAQFDMIRKQFAGQPLSSIMYADLQQTAPGMYQQYLQLSQMAMTFSGMGNGNDVVGLIPPLNRIMRFMKPMGGASWTNEQGYFSRSVTPFPTAEFMSPHGAMMGGLPGAAMGAGIMLPALGASRRTARQMQTNTQMRGLHQSLVMYAQSNRGRYTNDLYDLVDGNYFTIEYILSPIAGKTPPKDFDVWSSDQQRAWVLANTDFIFVPNLKEDLNTLRVAGFLDPEVTGFNGGSIVYNDNHVEWHNGENFMKELEKIEDQTGGMTWQDCIEATRNPKPWSEEEHKKHKSKLTK
ncbi:hypothetical protein KS4_30710 [Poriferisphaera corsica]|uniref:Uncharacterized protein n=1 Tax=Poriferisphaera corsica TaxID=2528020 RepID=A0A517YXP1_9BACT|nr:hypothetical protein [Poriferisphaera corsica]QDU34994.1 hypothetical protein KS4_30710 [Poriferisphaera corsica]